MPSPPPLLLVSPPPLPLPSPPPPAVSPPSEHTESVRGDIETLRARLASVVQEMVTLHARVGSLKKHDVVTRDSLRIVRDIEALCVRAEAAKQRAETLHVSLGATYMDTIDLIKSRKLFPVDRVP
ncbi:hypothetical protein Tco_0437933 [Tanacetum coccineum]